MSKEASIITGPRPRFAWRAMTSVLVTTSFSVIAVSGIILFVSPPGRIANWTNWAILGLQKRDWTALHIWFASLFIVSAIAHLLFNWRPLSNYFKDGLSRKLAFRSEWVVALAICGGVYAGLRTGLTPFSTLIAWNERVKESWDKPAERAPIPHAELLTLGELAAKAGIDLTTASNRLWTQGITGFTPETIVQKLSEANQQSAQQIYRLLVGSTSTRSESERGGEHGPGNGSGPGRKTLTEYCAEEGLDLKAALDRLQARGIKATADLTLREIAVNNGYNRPYELLGILKPAPSTH